MNDTLTEKPSSAFADLDLFWSRISAFAAEIETHFGSPEDLAQRLVLRRAVHGVSTGSLHHLERLLRLFLIAKADTIIDTLPPPKTQAPREQTGAHALSAASPAQAGVQPACASTLPLADAAEPEPEPQRRAFNPEAPASEWPVSFTVIRRKPEPRAGGARYISPEQRHNAEWRARRARLEAAGVRKPYSPPYEPKRFVSTRSLAMRYEAARRVLANIEPYVTRTARRLMRLRAHAVTTNYPEYTKVKRGRLPDDPPPRRWRRWDAPEQEPPPPPIISPLLRHEASRTLTTLEYLVRDIVLRRIDSG